MDYCIHGHTNGNSSEAYLSELITILEEGLQLLTREQRVETAHINAKLNVLAGALMGKYFS